jgi:hypothetical protein
VTAWDERESRNLIGDTWKTESSSLKVSRSLAQPCQGEGDDHPAVTTSSSCLVQRTSMCWLCSLHSADANQHSSLIWEGVRVPGPSASRRVRTQIRCSRGRYRPRPARLRSMRRAHVRLEREQADWQPVGMKPLSQHFTRETQFARPARYGEALPVRLFLEPVDGLLSCIDALRIRSHSRAVSIGDLGIRPPSDTSISP